MAGTETEVVKQRPCWSTWIKVWVPPADKPTPRSGSPFWTSQLKTIRKVQTQPTHQLCSKQDRTNTLSLQTNSTRTTSSTSKSACTATTLRAAKPHRAWLSRPDLLRLIPKSPSGKGRPTPSTRRECSTRAGTTRSWRRPLTRTSTSTNSRTKPPTGG